MRTGRQLTHRGCIAVTCFVLAIAARQTAAIRAADKKPDGKAPQASSQPADEDTEWQSLFDGKSLKGWTITHFGGEGEVAVDDGKLILPIGSDLTGVTIDAEKVKLPQSNYEVSLEAMRTSGSDFFCGLTFPVKKECCSLIVGGWGGGLCGLSSLGGYDASENETTTYQNFENNRWYTMRLRVTDKKIEAWIDKEQIVDHTLDDRRISVRAEVDLSQPFGLATWRTTAALKNIKLRRLPETQQEKQDGPKAKSPGPRSPKPSDKN